MKYAYIATGAANMYCGSCMRDNTLVAAMKSLGHDVTMLPMYTPLRVDEESVSEDHVFYGGIEAYLLQQFPQKSLLRDMMVKVASSQAILKMLPRFDIGSNVDPAQNAEMTLSMLRGEMGNQSPLLQEMVEWMTASLRPDLVHVTNTLISGVVPTIKKRLDVPVVCGLHGEDIFIDGLPDSYREQALDLIRENSRQIDHFIAISQYYADYFGPLVGIEPEKITLVRPGIALREYGLNIHQNGNGSGDMPLTIGYLARISPEKGLHILAEAFIRLCQTGQFPTLRLKASGYLSRVHAGYVAGIQERLDEAGVGDRAEILGTVDRQQKLDFLSSIDLFSVPTIYRDPKGLPVLEALANGVPVVQPDHGAFPELVNATGGGLLHRPEDPQDLADKLASLLANASLRQELGEKGKTAVHTHFSAHRMADETIQAYQSVFAKARLHS
jgi:glycosyltransferase involved in cell wall biosynthesis